MSACAACHGPADATRSWHGYVVCGDCFADLSTEDLEQRTRNRMTAPACPECLRSTPCPKCAPAKCLQPHVCHGPTCFVCDPDEPETCPDCAETSRCGACQDDFTFHSERDREYER